MPPIQCDSAVFGNEDARSRSLPMKTVPEALYIRAMVLENFEEALVSKDEGRRKGIIDVVIVGGAIIGSAVATFLALRPDWRGRIVVIERDPTYRTSSMRSWPVTYPLRRPTSAADRDVSTPTCLATSPRPEPSTEPTP